jgi:lipoprotein-anchoring transpeptidase ErfK/SrfK
MDFFTRKFTRREFLKIMGLGAAAAALPSGLVKAALSDITEGSWVRITRYRLYVFAEPNEKSKVQDLLKFDQLVKIQETLSVKDRKGSEHPWLKLGEDAYIQPIFVQYVENRRNVSNASIPEGGCLGEVTVPSIEAYYKPRGTFSKRHYYYASTHWVRSRVFDEYGVPWYELPDDMNGASYYVRAYAVRLVPAEELTPISADVPPDQKRIKLDLKSESVTAYEYDKPVFNALVSTGLAEGSTPYGTFKTHRKRPYRRMVLQSGDLNVDYDLPGVPWVSYITMSGVAFHGAYWHSNWGHRMSNGCINMRPPDAKWLYRWCNPTVPFDVEYLVGETGTRVDVVYEM